MTWQVSSACCPRGRDAMAGADIMWHAVVVQGHVKECKFRVLACAHCGEGCRDKDMQPHLRQ
eukprot:3938170-Rhodomonas_salina.1